MKKVLTIALSIITLSFAAISAEAKTPAAKFTPAPQIRIQIGGQRGRNRNNNRLNHRVRTVTQTRLLRVGRQMFRETYQTTIWPNGRTQTRVISRVRVR